MTFIRQVQPEIYTEQINFAAIKTALVAREKMQRRGRSIQSRPRSLVRISTSKLIAGGIRDIEFLVQCLQRVYGGADLGCVRAELYFRFRSYTINSTSLAKNSTI